MLFMHTWGRLAIYDALPCKVSEIFPFVWHPLLTTRTLPTAAFTLAGFQRPSFSPSLHTHSLYIFTLGLLLLHGTIFHYFLSI